MTLGFLLSVTGWVALRAVRAAVRPRPPGARAAAGRRLRRDRTAAGRPWRGYAGPATWSPRVRAGVLAGVLGLVVAAYAAAAVSVRGTDADTLYRRGPGPLQRRQARRGAAAVPRGPASRAALGHRHPLELLLVDHLLPQERLEELRGRIRAAARSLPGGAVGRGVDLSPGTVPRATRRSRMARSRRGARRRRASPTRRGRSTPASGSPKSSRDAVHRRHPGVQRGGDPRPEHRAPDRVPRRARTRVRGAHRLERLDRLDDRARCRSQPALRRR